MASRAGFLGALLLIFMFLVVIGVMFILYSAGVFVSHPEAAQAVSAFWLPAGG